MSKSSKHGSNDVVRTVIIGYGLAGSTFHAPFISSISGYQLTAVVTRDAERRKRAMQSHPDCEVFDSTDQIWQQADKFDLVIVTSPNSWHFEQARSAMESGLSVVVDKPAATSARQCQELIAVSERTQRLFTVFHNRRWDSDFATIQKIVNAGILGKVTRFESRFERWRPAIVSGKWQEQASVDMGGGRLWDFGSHLIDQSVVLFGAPLSVYAEIDARRDHNQADDDTFVAIEFQEEVRAHLWMSFLSRNPGPRFRISGLNGYFESCALDPQEDWLRAGHKPTGGLWNPEPGPWGTATIIEGSEALAERSALNLLPTSYGSFYIALLDALRGSAKVPVDPRQVLTTMRIIEAARESADKEVIINMSGKEVPQD